MELITASSGDIGVAARSPWPAVFMLQLMILHLLDLDVFGRLRWSSGCLIRLLSCCS
jgi:hypothetical protein